MALPGNAKGELGGARQRQGIGQNCEGMARDCIAMASHGIAQFRRAEAVRGVAPLGAAVKLR